ncbi:hypothetical protein IGK08_000597 [Enterococcus sp. DIV1286c]|nr:hypothetical protein UAC_02389 [Enterococcus mundtii ATCC 882]EOU11929.1 hypothetical protein I587_00449 [Enterococcus mundtii ATCC 882]
MKSTYKRYCSLIILLLSISVITFSMVQGGRYSIEWRVILTSICWLLSSISLFFSRFIESKALKNLVNFLNFSCIYGWLFSFS